jgi:hypothetical protein
MFCIMYHPVYCYVCVISKYILCIITCIVYIISYRSMVPRVSRGVYRGRGDHSLKVERVGSRRDVGKFSFAKRTGREWNSLPQEWRLEKVGILDVPLTATQWVKAAGPQVPLYKPNYVNMIIVYIHTYVQYTIHME